MMLVSLNVLINIEKGELVDSNNKIINPHDYKIILNIDEDVYKSSQKLTLLAMVTSASHHFENRVAIRKTWAHSRLFPG